MKTARKALYLAVAMLFVCSAFIGCQTAAPTSAPVATQEATVAPEPTAAPFTIDWYVNEGWYLNPEGNLCDKLITELTGVKLNFIVPVGDANQKLNTMIAANSLPDMVTCYWGAPQAPQLCTDDYSYALSDLADQYSPDFWKVTSPDVVGWYKAKNGKLYAYPCFGNSPEDTEKYKVISNRSFLVRKDIYEAIGSPDMRTPAGFLKALNDAKAKYPAVDNGQPLVPFGVAPFTPTGNTAVEDMLLEFLAVPREINGQYFDIKCANPDPDYKAWLKAFRQANQDGNIPTDVFVDDRVKIEEKIQQGRYFALLYQWKDAMTPLGQVYTNKPEQIYISVDGPANSKLDPPKLGVTGYSGWEITMISKNCKDPKRCIEFMTFGLSEKGQMAFFCGKEGETYDMVDGKPIIKPEINKLKNSDMPTFKQKYNTFGEIWMFDTQMMSTWEPDPGLPFTQYKSFNAGKGWFYGLYDNIRPLADTEEFDIITKAENKWGEILPKLLMAKTDAEFDQIWADYEAYKTSINYQKVLDYQRQQVEANKAKIGAK